MRAQVLARRFFCVAAVLFVSASLVQAATISVDDDGPADYNSLRRALAAAQSGDTIVVQPGTYAGTAARDLVLAGKTVTIQSSNPVDVDVVAATVIDCRASDGLGHRFIEISPKTGAGLTLDGLTFINATGAFAGAVVLCEDANLDVRRCTFTNNGVQWWGGALYCDSGSVTIESCTFKNNASQARHGGAVFCKNSTLTVTDSTFLQNTGNAIKFFDSAVTVIGCTFDRNVGHEGGAIYGNTALDAETPGYLSLDDCTFTANTCDTSGGALHSYGLEVAIASCTFTANTATENGGALYNHRSSPTVTNCVFDENRAGGLGGAIANFNTSRPEILHATFVSNEAARGGAISSRRDSDPLLSHCILWNNQADSGPNFYLAQETLIAVYTSNATVAWSDVEGGQSSAHVDPGCTLVWGDGNFEADPLFTGQALRDYHLSSDSSCIDAGDPAGPASAGATDRDGLPRRYGKAADPGAYEYQGMGPVYRFWAPSQSRHFYTISGSERDWLIANHRKAWTFEGIAYYAFYQNSEPGLLPVYRFWSPALGSHIWTTLESERNKLIQDPNVWADEGIAFYAYDPARPPLGSSPVYRFWSAQLGYHFYTIDESEKNRLITEYPNVWTLERISFYAYSTAYKPQQATYEFTGEDENVTYTMTLAAYVDGVEAIIDNPNVRLATTTARMRMKTDFTDLTTTLNDLRLESELDDHATTIRLTNAKGLSIPFSVSAQATFKALTPRGPFAIDPASGNFADFTVAPETLPGENEAFAYRGLVSFAKQTVDFDRTTEALQFELASYGTFGSLSMLSEGASVELPLTFQWRSPRLRDPLVEATVDGRFVQIFVSDVYLGTQSVWPGKVAE